MLTMREAEKTRMTIFMCDNEANVANAKLRYLVKDRSRHGKRRLYVRVPGRPSVRLLVDDTADPYFPECYARGLKGEQWRPPVKAGEPESRGGKLIVKATKALPGSFRAMVIEYLRYFENDPRSSPVTKAARRRYLERVCQAATAPDSPYLLGDMPAKKFGKKHLLLVRDRMIATPEAANAMHKAVRALLDWAVERDIVTANPAADVEHIKTYSEGFKTWTEAHIARFIARHPLGTKAHLAMSLLLYIGPRRSDVVKFGPNDVRNQVIHFEVEKNNRRLHKELAIPILPVLDDVLKASSLGKKTYLETEYGKPFTPAGFGNWFRDRCDEAGLQGLSAHGLRKALQVIGSENDLTDRELMAIAGHESEKETSRYTKKRDRTKLAASGMKKLAEGRFQNKSFAPENGVEKGAPETIKKAN
jgi:integrase